QAPAPNIWALGSGLAGFRVVGARVAHAGDHGDVDEVQVMAADHDLVTVGERAPLHPLAVDEHAVEAAVVEHPQAGRLADDQRVAPGDGGVVEANVGGQAAPDAGPLARERVGGDVVAGPV